MDGSWAHRHTAHNVCLCVYRSSFEDVKQRTLTKVMPHFQSNLTENEWVRYGRRNEPEHTKNMPAC